MHVYAFFIVRGLVPLQQQVTTQEHEHKHTTKTTLSPLYNQRHHPGNAKQTTSTYQPSG